MDIDAALMTGKGTGAISTIQIFGVGARPLLRKLFRPVGTRPARFTMGEILLGTICDGAEVIDQVTLGCEGPGNFAIHCHGNPLIVEMIMELLRKHGANLVTSEQLLARTLAVQEWSNTIAIEARLAQANTKTLEGAKIVTNQVDSGLAKTAQDWLDGMDRISLDEIKAEAVRILRNSQPAKLIMYGCTAVLTGPPNSGKSTLLNYLAGRQKAIVTDIKGTTRDWVEATCRIGPLSVRLIDTAGLDQDLSGPGKTIEEASQAKTAEILERADIILLVLDGSEALNELGKELTENISGKGVITVLNKCDLPVKLQSDQLPEFLPEPARISAKEATGIEALTESIRRTSRTVDFDLRQSVCFTNRQENLLTQVTNAESKRQAASIIMDLLDGQV